MGDPYWRYGASRTSAPPPVLPDRGTTPFSSFPGSLLPEASTMNTYNPFNPKELSSGSANFLQKDILPSHTGDYHFDDIPDLRSEHCASGLMGGANIKGYPPFEDSNVLGLRRDVFPRPSPGFVDRTYERPSSVRRSDGPTVADGQSNILFVDGVPTDTTRRELGHLFRPFIGFRELRVVHKEPRRRGDKAMVLCFVEFTDVKCALTAMEALQGYKFDDRKPDSHVLKIHFAHFPFRLPSQGEETLSGGLR